MFSKIAKWFFSATPKLNVVEKKPISAVEVLINDVNKLLKEEEINKAINKADCFIFKVNMHTRSVHKLVEISKAIHYKVIDVEAYRDVSQNFILMDIGYYFKSNVSKIDVKGRLEDFLVVLNHYNSKLSLTFKEKAVLEDISTLVQSIDYLVNYGRVYSGNGL